MDEVTVGVVLPFYYGARPEEFRESLDSILNQDRDPDHVVIVADGPVSQDLMDVVDDFRTQSEAAEKPTRIQFIHLPENVGGARARMAGISVLDTDYVVGQDADDISLPNRISRTLQFMQEHDLDFAGCYLGEFQEDPGGPLVVRRYPTTPEELRKAIRINNPIAHPALVLRRSSAIAAGGYQHLLGNEDYDLFARMVAKGYRGASVPEVLVLFRSHPDVFRRRGGKEFIDSELELSRRMRSYGLVGPVQRWSILGVRLGYRLAPAWLKQRAYHRVVANTES